MKGFPIKKMKEITRLITDGKHGDCANEPNSGYYFISCKDVNNNRINYGNARQITKNDFIDTHKRTQLEPGDIVLTNSGTIGRMAIVSNNDLTGKTTFQKSVAIIKPDHNSINNKYLYYCLKAQLPLLIELAGGTAQKNLLLGDLREFKFRS